MAPTVKHSYVSAIPDSGDTTVVQPSDWNANHVLTGVQGTITLTTTGTSGVATLVADTLNIPDYGSATSNVTVGTTTVSGGSTTRVLYDNAGVLGEYSISGSGSVAMTTSPVFVTPTLGAASGTSLNLSGLSASQVVATDGSKNLISLTSTGSGSVVRATSPTIITPTIAKLANLTSNGLVTTSAGDGTLGVTVPGTGVLTALAVNTGTAGSFVVNGGALGTPSSGTATNLTGTASGLTAGNVTTNANLTGPITSVGNATSIASQTGTGTKFVVDTSPTIVSPSITTSLLPTADDGAPLGSTTKEWSDLFLASGGVVNWANGNVTVTHSTDALTLGVNSFQLQSATTLFPKTIVSNTTNDANAAYFLVRKDRAGAAVQVGDTLGTFLFQGRDSSGTPTIRNAAFLTASVVSVTAGTVAANFNLTAGTASWQFNTNSQTIVPGGLSRGAPVTKTADFTVADTESWLINNKAGSTCTVTMPSAASYVGREIMFKNSQAQTVVSSASNIVPQTGGAATTALLASGTSHWCKVVSDGTNWVIMQSA